MVRDKVVTTVVGAPRAMATAGVAARVDMLAADEAAVASVVLAVVATAAVADLLAAVGDVRGGSTSGASAPPTRATSSSSVPSARCLATRRAHTHRTRRCW